LEGCSHKPAIAVSIFVRSYNHEVNECFDNLVAFSPVFDHKLRQSLRHTHQARLKGVQAILHGWLENYTFLTVRIAVINSMFSRPPRYEI
jgi:hypothetical protein